MVQISGNDWIRQSLTSKGRDWTMQNYELFKKETGSELSLEWYPRQVRKIIADIDEKISGEPKKEITESHEVESLQDSLSFHDVPEDRFQIKKLTTNTWGSTTNPNKQVKVEFEPIEKEIDITRFGEIFLEITKDYIPPKIKYEPKNYSNKVLEISVPDLHMGQIIYSESVEHDQNYGPQEAKDVYLDAVNNLTKGFQSGELGMILFPFGEDFLNIDNLNSTTTAGTPQWNTDPYLAIETGLSAVFAVIDRLILLAPVHVPVITGNHDRLSTYLLGKAIEQRYRNIPTVTIDSSPKKAKNFARGNYAIRMVHIDKQKPDKLIFEFATCEPEMWAKAKFREIHVGHLHHHEEMARSSYSKNGVKIVFLPSLAPADQWHSDNGYHSMREAQARLWDDERGCTEVRMYRP
jgi:hypothetical protein